MGLRHGDMWIRDVECPVGVAAIAQAAGEERVAGPIRDHSMAAVAGGGVAGAVLRADLRGHRTRAKQKEGAGRRIAHRAGAAGCASSAARPLRVWPAACILRAVPSRKRRRSAVMTPRNVGLRADGVVASHRATDGTGRSMKHARTYAHGISRGDVAVLRARWGASAGSARLA